MQTTETSHTVQQYEAVIQQCLDIFTKKTQDYGTAWRVLRTISIVDQIYIKAQRIRTIQEKGTQQIGDDIPSEFMGILNYAVIGLIQLSLTEQDPEELEINKALSLYTAHVQTAKELMLRKNHDYGEAWRALSQE